MRKTVIKVALLGATLAFGGCSTYNSYAPDWAKIGSSDTEAQENSDATENGSAWWNPFTW